MVVMLAWTIAKYMNFEYIPQHWLNQQFNCKKQKLPLVKKRQCLLFPKATLTITSTPNATDNLFRKKQQCNLLSNQKHYLQPTQLQGAMGFKHISK